MAPSATRVAFKHLVKQAGGVDFMDYVEGTDLKRAFREAVDQAGYESGRGGYSGTIAEKHSVTLRSSTPMTRAKANEFADRDLHNNDKWGPAFAVPVAEEKVLQQQEYTVTVKAPTADKARELGRNAILEKGRTRAGATVEVLIPYNGVKKSKEGGIPPVETKPLTETYFMFNTGSGRHYPDKRSALTAFKAMLEGGDDHVRQPGREYLLTQVKEIAKFKVSGEPSRLPVWEVTGVRKQVALGKTKGYLFYGIASS